MAGATETLSSCPSRRWARRLAAPASTITSGNGSSLGGDGHDTTGVGPDEERAVRIGAPGAVVGRQRRRKAALVVPEPDRVAILETEAVESLDGPGSRGPATTGDAAENQGDGDEGTDRRRYAGLRSRTCPPSMGELSHEDRRRQIVLAPPPPRCRHHCAAAGGTSRVEPEAATPTRGRSRLFAAAWRGRAGPPSPGGRCPSPRRGTASRRWR